MFLDMNVSVALDYSTDSEISNETEVSHRPITVLEASQGDPEGEQVTNILVESHTKRASSQSNSSQSRPTTPAPLPRSKRLVTYVSATQKHANNAHKLRLFLTQVYWPLLKSKIKLSKMRHPI